MSKDIDSALGVTSLRLPAEPASVPGLRDAARRWAIAAGLDAERIGDVALAVTEAATNAVLHAFVGRERGTVALRVVPGDGRVEFRVTDDGRGLTPRIDSPGLGLGLPTIGRLTDHLDVGPSPEGGTEVRMVFAAPDMGDPDGALRERLAASYERLHEAVLVHDEQGRFVYANAPALEMLGLGGDELSARAPGETAAQFDIRLPDGSPVALEDWPHRRLFAGEERPGPLLARSVELATGRTSWSETTATLLVDGPTGRRLSLGTVRDVTEAVESAARARMLAETGRRLQLAEVDLESTFEEIAHSVVPDLADWCAVDVVDDGGLLRRVALAHRDPEKVALGRAIHERWPPDPADQTGPYGVLASGEPLHIAQITEDMFDVLEDADRRRALLDVGMRSVILAPMRGRSGAVGLMVLVHADSGRVFDERDLAFAQQLADRAGVAVDNARLIDRSRPGGRPG